MVRVEVVFVVLDEVAGDRLAVVRGEEFGRSMPELAQVIGLLVVEGVFKFCITAAKLLEEGVLGRQAIEVEGIARREDDNLFRKVAVIRVIEAI